MRALLIIPFLVAPAAACVDDPTLDPAPAPPAVTSGDYHHFAQTGWHLPATVEESDSMGFDLDGDGAPNNQAGRVISLLINIGLEIQTTNVDAFSSGSTVVLHSVRADSLADDASVSWRILNGIIPTAPRFDGTDTYFPTSDEGLLSGAIAGGVLEARDGTVTLRLPMFPDQPALVLPLVDARIVMRPGDECRGTIGGAIAKDVRDSSVLPQIAASAVEHMALHPDHEFTSQANRVFDENGDGVATADEISGGNVAEWLLRLDVDRDGDGESDAVSVGLEFFCQPATFAVTAE